MQSLLRTRPENLEDLTVQVALVRPGPIQGKAVHPYVQNREQLRADPTFQPTYDHPLLEEPLGETYGAIVFQEQVLHVAMALAGFSVGEAEGLRRAMSRKRSEEAIEAFRARFVEGALGNGVDETADAGLRQADRLLGLRLPEVARRRVRAARVPVGLAAPLLPDRVPLRAPERAADGLLPAVDARARRAAQAGWRCVRPTSTARARSARTRTAPCGSGSSTSRTSARTTRASSSRSASATAVPRRARARAAHRARSRRARGARLLGRVRLPRREPAGAALGARPRPARADRARLGRRGAAARAPARPDRRDAGARRADRAGSGCSPTTG